MLQRLIVQWILGNNIHQAANAGDLARVRALLVSDPLSVNARDAQDMTPLHLAAAKGHLHVAEVLVANGAELNVADVRYRLTPLHLAAQHGHQLMTKFLLAKGANVDATDANGHTPITLARERRKPAVVELLQGAPGAK